MIVFFFFQAEDGIRDKLVTGVQTCALPISRPAVPAIAAGPAALPDCPSIGSVEPSCESPEAGAAHDGMRRRSALPRLEHRPYHGGRVPPDQQPLPRPPFAPPNDSRRGGSSGQETPPRPPES